MKHKRRLAINNGLRRTVKITGTRQHICGTSRTRDRHRINTVIRLRSLILDKQPLIRGYNATVNGEYSAKNCGESRTNTR
jgi:hypothetical protein